jgi:hypothetical protein
LNRRASARCAPCAGSGPTSRSVSSWLPRSCSGAGLPGRPGDRVSGSTVIIGPDGQIRYLISKCVANPKRAKEQLRRLGSVGSGKAWKVQDGRLFVPQISVCELHGCIPKNGRLDHKIQSPEDAAIIPIGRGGGGQNALQPEERR